jgi:hypothetical protein
MFNRFNKATALVHISAVAALLAAPLSTLAVESGTAQDNVYAAKVWDYALEHKFIGEGRLQSYPFKGHRPHGSIQEVVATTAEIDGQKGRLIVKHNYGAKDKLTVQDVYANPDMNYEALTIMFQREKGYDPDHNDWFWAEYKANGEIIVYNGEVLSGRAPLCTGCHAALGGPDREILNGKEK